MYKRAINLVKQVRRSLIHKQCKHNKINSLQVRKLSGILPSKLNKTIKLNKYSLRECSSKPNENKSETKPENNNAFANNGDGGGNGLMYLLLLGGLGAGGYYYYTQNYGANSMPEIKSKDSLVYKYLTPEIYNKYKGKKTKTSGITLDQCIACAVQLDNQHVGIYAGDGECYVDYKDLFDPIIKDYHNFDGKHKSDMNPRGIKKNIDKYVPVKSTRIRVGRNIEGFGLSPGITKEDRLEVERLMIGAFKSLKGDLAGEYYPLLGMNEKTRQKLVDDHFLFMSGDPNLQIAGMERDWPEGRGIFLNKSKTFLVWVNEEDQLRIISMQKGGDAVQVFERLSRGIKAIEDYLQKNGRKYQFNDKLGYIHSCPTNLGTGMRASVHIDLGSLKNKLGGTKKLKDYCKTLKLQARGTHGESGGDTGTVYDISNRHRLGYTEVELVQTMIDGVNRLYRENKQAKRDGY